MSAAVHRTVDWFHRWFTSPAAFVQGTVFLLIWLVGIAFNVFDRSGWWLLFILTVFSGITQFPLGYAARKASEEAERVAESQRQLIKAIQSAVAKQADMLDPNEDGALDIHTHVEEIAASVRRIESYFKPGA